MFLLYEGLLYVAFLVGLPFFLLTGLARGKYLGSFWERLGHYSSSRGDHDLWIHAVSVGEAIAARPVVSRLLAQNPALRIVITTTTATGQAMARKIFPELEHAYFPFDFSRSVHRFLDHHHPRVFATVETEIWPNLSRIAFERGTELVITNGRISDRSFPRYRSVRWLLRPILRRYSAILAREPEDAKRFVEIGASPEAVEVVGNVKFDFEPSLARTAVQDLVERLREGRKLFVLGSTVAGEDEIVIPLLARLIEETGCFVVLAPRKPERFGVVAALLGSSAIPFVRRSQLEGSSNASGRIDLLLLDSIGELASLYRDATVTFVGGSLVPSGGHNPIEPAAVGAPVAFGASMSNFREIADLFLRSDAAVQVPDGEALIDFAKRMLTSPDEQIGYARRAREVVARNRGAAERTANRLLELLG